MESLAKRPPAYTFLSARHNSVSLAMRQTETRENTAPHCRGEFSGGEARSEIHIC